MVQPDIGLPNVSCGECGEWGWGYGYQKQLTPMAENRVIPIDPKYTAVNGSRGSEIRCLMYTTGPIMTAQEARKSTEPIDHLHLMGSC